MKLRVTIDLGKADDMAQECLSDSSMSLGVFGVDLEGVYRSWYGSPSYLCEFTDIEVISHDGETKHPNHSEECETLMKCTDCKTIREMHLDLDTNRDGVVENAEPVITNRIDDTWGD